MSRPYVIPIFIPHFGCSHRCVFCNQSAITGAQDFLPTPEDIRSTIGRFLEYKKKNRSHTEVSFFGGNFLGLPPELIKQFLEETAKFVDLHKIDGIRFSTRPDTIDKDRLDLISLYPVTTIEIGVQSMDDNVLTKARRGHSAADTIHAVGLLKQKKYNIGLQMMTGLPGDSDAGSLQTAGEIIKLSPDFVRIYPTIVIAGSALAGLYKKGEYTPRTIDDCVVLLKQLYRLFYKNNIVVIRMGLQASEELDDASTVIAGPYHPALGHMVYSEIMLDQAKKKFNELPGHADRVTITVHPKNFSRMQGLNKQNIDVIKQNYDIKDVKIKTDSSLTDFDVRVVF